MASIVKLGKGKQPPRAIDFVDHTDLDQTGVPKRKRVRLGTVTHEEAREAKCRIEKLHTAKHLNQSLDSETAQWLAGVSDTIHRRLERAGLCQSREPQNSVPTLDRFIEKHLDQRKTELKPASIKRLRETGDRLINFFGAETLIDEISPDNAKDWRAEMASESITEGTVRLHCRNAKTIFNDAADRELIARNPFALLKSAAVAAQWDHYVSPADAIKIIEACPCVQWRVLFGLCRYAGLRCSSETHRVAWQDVNWERRSLSVYAPKTDSTRVVPILPELYAILTEAFYAAPEGAENIITLSENNRHRMFKEIIRRAGLVEWPELFQTLRRSCETQLAAQHPQHAVSTWIGHSMQVSEQHYLRVTDDVFARATRSSAESAAVCSGTVSQSKEGQDGLKEEQLATSFKSIRECSTNRDDAVVCEMSPAGFEPTTYGLKVRCSTG